MTTLIKWSTILMACLYATLPGAAQHVTIISSQEISETLKMDLHWVEAAAKAGFSSNILTSNNLNDFANLGSTDILVLAASVDQYTSNQKSNILSFIQSGGHIYIQSEYLDHLGGNILFNYLVENTNGIFQWENQIPNNIGPVQIINGFETDGFDNFLNYFWYGVSGCGDESITPFLTKGGSHYGFFYRSSLESVGNVITNADQDWIRKISDGDITRKALLVSILDKLANGLETEEVQSPVLNIDSDYNPCEKENLSAQIINGDPSIIQWFINDEPYATGPQIPLDVLQENDNVYASYTYLSGCFEKIVRSQTIVIEVASASVPAFETTLSGQHVTCSDTEVHIEAKFDESLIQVSHQWFLNGQLSTQSGSTFSSSKIEDEDVLEHHLIYLDGCAYQTIVTQDQINFTITEVSTPNIEIVAAKDFFCNEQSTEVNLNGLEQLDNALITWYVGGTIHPNNTAQLVLENVNQSMEIYASIAYTSTCGGEQTLSTSSVDLIYDAFNIEVLELDHISCFQSKGMVEVASNDPSATYIWNDGDTQAFKTDLQPGTYAVTATSADGCQDFIAIQVEDQSKPIIENITVTQPVCIDDMGLAMLILDADIEDEVTIKWWNANDELVGQNVRNVHLAPGQYLTEVSISGYCMESSVISIEAPLSETISTKDTILTEVGKSVELEINFDFDSEFSIQWSDESLSCQSCFTQEILVSQSRAYHYELTSEQGCTINGYVWVFAQPKSPFYAPNAFSPDNDGLNDYYKVLPRSGVTATSNLKVFDRWGSLIFEDSSEQKFGWDGKSFGKSVQKGIYVFFQEFTDENGQKHKAQGSLTLL